MRYRPGYGRARSEAGAGAGVERKILVRGKIIPNIVDKNRCFAALRFEYFVPMQVAVNDIVHIKRVTPQRF